MLFFRRPESRCENFGGRQTDLVVNCQFKHQLAGLVENALLIGCMTFVSSIGCALSTSCDCVLCWSEFAHGQVLTQWRCSEVSSGLQKHPRVWLSFTWMARSPHLPC